MDGRSCCGRSFLNKFNIRTHIRSRHNMASPIYKCFLEGHFRNKNAFKEHQSSHIYNSNLFHIEAQAFNNSTLVLKGNLVGEQLENFNFFTSEVTTKYVFILINWVCSPMTKLNKQTRYSAL